VSKKYFLDKQKIGFFPFPATARGMKKADGIYDSGNY